jgi:ribosomal protein L7/L12
VADLRETAAAMRAAGTGLDEVLAELRSQGASITQCLKIVREVEGVPLGRAKEIVDGSVTWSDMREANARLRGDLARTWSELPE